MKKAIKKITDYLKSNSHKDLKVTTDQNQEVEFKLYLPEIEVGKLSFKEGKWFFSYSDEFKKSGSYLPIADFPSLEKSYSNESLWPFFLSRIPSLSRSRIKNTVEKEAIDRTDLLEMLDRFGKQTITNPYLLESE
tara:strand:+ start:6940 stop:7344 length:405 start_codon:yes stop_codon:yes gene_type:complete